MPGSSDFRHDIALSLWDFNIVRTPSLYTPLSLDAYFKYHNEQADLFVHDTGQHVFVRTHQHVVEISKIVKDDIDYNDALEKVRLQTFPNKGQNQGKALTASLDLVVRLLLMVEVGSIPNGFSGNSPWIWNQGKLSQFLLTRFAPRMTSSQEWVKLGRVFTARNIERIAGIKIKWTNNLADHLRLFDSEEGEMVVNIFHHASFLMMLQNRYVIQRCRYYQDIIRLILCSSSTQHGAGNLFPTGLVEETLRTLRLLLPRSEKAGVAWYKAIAIKNHLDLNACLCPHLRVEDRQIDRFDFWRERLIILKQAFDEAEPNSWSQWWHDKRRGVHRYPLLLAAAALLLTLILGVIQVIEGGLQVYTAFQAT